MNNNNNNNIENSPENNNVKNNTTKNLGNAVGKHMNALNTKSESINTKLSNSNNSSLLNSSSSNNIDNDNNNDTSLEDETTKKVNLTGIAATANAIANADPELNNKPNNGNKPTNNKPKNNKPNNNKPKPNNNTKKVNNNIEIPLSNLTKKNNIDNETMNNTSETEELGKNDITSVESQTDPNLKTNQNSANRISLNRLCMNLLNHQIVMKLYHFQTELYGAHKASDAYISKYADTLDKFLEVAQGIYGKITLKKYSLSGTAHNDENIIKHINGMITYWRTKIDDVLAEYTDLINIRDELVADAEQLKYLLSFR